ncbi:cholecystokinin receptor type A-like [Saccostrea echinata]|uniref:cholecystokinin receptor type A-like n=1 Tax=Saccostrea echinata TaxID=191078 RepID=UPI002A82A170|nr:cholecystokinin receptor type A-like [Saccostrea echinata]
MDVNKTIGNPEISKNSSVLNLTDLQHQKEALQRLNDQLAHLLTPVIAFLSLLMVFGILGNLLVLYVYEFRFKRSSSRTFILCLALLDFVACVIGMPYHIYDMYHTYTYYDEASCKGLSYILGVTVTASSFVLALISIDRYRKICKPFGKQISDLGTKKACFASVIFASLFGIPNIIMYGNSSIEVPGENFTGVECYIKDEYESSESYIYFGLFFFLFITTTIVLIVLYSLVGFKIRQRAANISTDSGSVRKEKITAKGRRSFSFCGGSDPETTDEILSETDDSLSTIKVKTISYKKGSNETHSECRMEYETAVTPIFKGVIEQEKESSSSQNSHTRSSMIRNKKKGDPRKKKSLLDFYKRQTMSMSDDDSEECRQSVRGSLSVKSLSKRQKRTVRITGMLFMITLIYIVSFLPHLVLLVLEFMDPDSFENLSPMAFTGYNFLLRSYFINNMANPFVYGFLDPKFRHEVLFLFKSIVNCKHGRIFRR